MLMILGSTGGLGGGLINYVNSHSDLAAEYGELVAVNRLDLDVEDENSVARFCDNLQKKLKTNEPIWVINAVGVSLNGYCHKMSADLFEKTIRVNLTGSFLLLKHLQPLLKERPGSSIVFLSSVVGELGIPGTIAYASSKSALRGLVKTAAREFARFKVTVNVLELGYFEKGMIEQLSPAQLSETLQQVPLNRLGTVAELFKACDFSLKNSFLTGSVIKLNGGLN